jgi:hypothetical protein
MPSGLILIIIPYLIILDDFSQDYRMPGAPIHISIS